MKYVCVQIQIEISTAMCSSLFMGNAMPHRCCYNKILKNNFIYEPKVPNKIMDTWQSVSKTRQLANCCQYLNASGVWRLGDLHRKQLSKILVIQCIFLINMLKKYNKYCKKYKTLKGIRSGESKSYLF